MQTRTLQRTAIILSVSLIVIGADGPPPSGAAPRADIYEFSLRPTRRGRGASAAAFLQPPASPFGIAVSREGFLEFDLELDVRGLRPAKRVGPYATYSVWITTPELDRTEKLGNLEESGSLNVRVVGMNKFILMITAEASVDADKRSGPIMLRGVSPSGLLTAFGTHELFSTMPHE